jgi:3-oxoacyl-[acyl-carrier-protein] synthase-3
MNASFDCAQIAGIVATVPAKVCDLHDFSAQWGEKEVEQIIAGTGVSRIRQAPAGMTASDLCFASAQKLLLELEVDPKIIDGIVFVSQTPDYLLPASSALLQDRLGLKKQVTAFDINYGCSGYVYGLLQAHLLIQSKMCKLVLVCAGDVSTSMINPRDRALKMLFGDAGSATLVEVGTDSHSFAVRTDGSGARSLIIPAGGARQPRDAETCIVKAAEDGNYRSAENLYMDGIAVLFFALREVPEVIDELLVLAGWAKSEVSLYVLHQANRFMVEYLSKKMRLPNHLVPFSCSEIGNVGPASIPALLSIDRQRLSHGNQLDKVVLCGFGVGFSVAAMTLSLRNTRIFDMQELN